MTVRARLCRRIVYHDLPSDDPIQRQPELALAREKLGGWEATTSLEEGLEKTIDYFRRTYDL